MPPQNDHSSRESDTITEPAPHEDGLSVTVENCAVLPVEKCAV